MQNIDHICHISVYRDLLDQYSRQLDDIDGDLNAISVSSYRANRELDRLEMEHQDLLDELENFKDQSIDIESSNVEG